jgi:hypothetical protein
MTKAGVKRFLALYFLILFGAVILRIDWFPLSWVPMYGLHRDLPVVARPLGSLEARGRGFIAERANGERLTISARDLNVPDTNFRRLYTQRAFNWGPPQDNRERYRLAPFNRWWYETLVGPDPLIGADYPRQLLASINRTFGYAADDPRRIARMQAQLDFALFERDHLRRGDISAPKIDHRVALVDERGSWLRTGDRLIPMADARMAYLGASGD